MIKSVRYQIAETAESILNTIDGLNVEINRIGEPKLRPAVIVHLGDDQRAPDEETSLDHWQMELNCAIYTKSEIDTKAIIELEQFHALIVERLNADAVNEHAGRALVIDFYKVSFDAEPEIDGGQDLASGVITFLVQFSHLSGRPATLY
jgi:hypothetical protein